jgi:hypothetical protein
MRFTFGPSLGTVVAIAPVSMVALAFAALSD